MGDVRFLPDYERVRDATNRAAAIEQLDDEALVAALAGSAMVRDEYLANVLATAAQNRAQVAARTFDSIPMAVLSLSHPTRRVERASLRAREMIALPVSELGGTPAEAILAREADAPLLEAFLDEPAVAIETTLRAPSGASVRAELTGSIVEDAHGRRTGTMVVIQPVAVETLRRLPVLDLSSGGPKPFEVSPLVTRAR